MHPNVLQKMEEAVLLEFIDGLPWKKVSHAYGVANDAPIELRRLLSQDDDERFDAICGFLLSSAFHQYTIYPATPYVMLCVLKILKFGSINELDSGFGDLMASQLLHFLMLCVERGQKGIYGPPHSLAPTIEVAAMKGMELFREFTEHDDAAVANEARALLEWAQTQKM